MGLLIAAAACAEGVSSAEAPEVTSEQVYLAATRIFTSDESPVTSYFHVLDSIDETTKVDPAQALEVPGSARLYAIEGSGWFAIGEEEAPVISRYALDAKRRLQKRESISLQRHGVVSLGSTLYPVSKDKFYYADNEGSQLIVVDPKRMVVTGAIDLRETVREGYLSSYGYSAVRRGDKLIFPVAWFDWTDDRVLAETGLVVIDTEHDRVERVDVDTRCAGITQPVVLESGDAYFASSALAGAAYRRERLSQKPCVLRMAAGADAFDPDYARDLAELAGATIAGEPIPAGGNALFLRVLDDKLAEVDESEPSWDLIGQSAWRWLRWDAERDTAEPVESLAASTADVVWFEVGERVFGTETPEDYSETKLIELTTKQGPTERVTVPGFMHGLAQVR